MAARQVPAGTGMRSIWSGVFTDAQAERGSVAYLMSCSRCHLANLMGDSAEEIPGLVGDALREKWDNESLAGLFERVSTRMPADKPGSLPAGDYADIVAYVLRANGFPSGRDELRPDAVALRGVVLAWKTRAITAPEK